jgi:hypothetical protein
MHRVVSCGAIALAGVIALTACSQAAVPSGPSWTSGESNIAYAVSAICAPFVFDGRDATSLPMSRPLVSDDGWNEVTFERLGARPVRVGLAGFVHVAVAAKDGRRQCEVTSSHADPQALRASALAVLARRSEGFAPTRSRYAPGRFAAEDMLCAAATSPHPGGFVLLSAARPENRDQVAVLLSLSDGAPRMASCDHDGVRMNYRTLITP